MNDKNISSVRAKGKDEIMTSREFYEIINKSNYEEEMNSVGVMTMEMPEGGEPKGLMQSTQPDITVNVSLHGNFTQLNLYYTVKQKRDYDKTLMMLNDYGMREMKMAENAEKQVDYYIPSILFMVIPSAFVDMYQLLLQNPIFWHGGFDHNDSTTPYSIAILFMNDTVFLEEEEVDAQKAVRQAEMELERRE